MPLPDKLTLEDLDRLLEEPQPRIKYAVTSPRVARLFEVAGKMFEARVRGWRDGWQEARFYRRLYKSLCR